MRQEMMGFWVALASAGPYANGSYHMHMDHMQTICTSPQTDNYINTSSVNFYRLDALPDAQPTVSKQ